MSERRLDALGVLTVIVYGTWFYGFGVLFSTLSAEHNVSAATLGITYGVANLLAGMGAVITGRRLDSIGPRAVLGLVGPFGACVYFMSSQFTGDAFLVCYALGGGLMGAAGFYSFTQPLSVRIIGEGAARAITRLTIWGAFSSPIMIPLTELLRSHYGWQTAIRVPAVLTAVAFVVCAIVCVPKVPSVRVTHSLWGTLGIATKNWRLRRFAFAAFLASVAASTLLVYQVPTMQWAGVSSGSAALFASARGLWQLAGRLPLVAAMEKWGAPRLMTVARAALGFAPLFLLGSGRWVVAAIYVVIAGITIGALSALDGVLAREVVGAENFGSIMGGIGLIATLGGSVGPILGGQLRDACNSPVASMLLVCATAWLAMLVFASLRLGDSAHSVSNQGPSDEGRAALTK